MNHKAFLPRAVVIPCNVLRLFDLQPAGMGEGRGWGKCSLLLFLGGIGICRSERNLSM